MLLFGVRDGVRQTIKSFICYKLITIRDYYCIVHSCLFISGNGQQLFRRKKDVLYFDSMDFLLTINNYVAMNSCC